MRFTHCRSERDLETQLQLIVEKQQVPLANVQVVYAPRDNGFGHYHPAWIIAWLKNE